MQNLPKNSKHTKQKDAHTTPKHAHPPPPPPHIYTHTPHPHTVPHTYTPLIIFFEEILTEEMSFKLVSNLENK